MNVSIIWDDEPGGNVEHIALNGLTPTEVDDVLEDDTIPTNFSNSSGLPCKIGTTSTGKVIFVSWQKWANFLENRYIL
jgi:hypothetical protein